MQPEVQKLLEVQRVDQKIARLRREAESIPREESKRLGDLETLRRSAQESKNELVQAQLRVRELELSIKQCDSEIKNLEGKLGIIKNNAEYQAILFQIEAVKRERDSFEEETLVLLDKSSPLEEIVKRAEDAVASEEEVFDEFKAESEKILVAHEVEITEIGGGRDELLVGIPPELIEEYGRLFEVRDNLAICAAESQYCQGCYTQFTVNDLARLQGGKVIVRCSSCKRILYLES